MKLNLYLVHQGTVTGYDTFSAMVVAAATPEAAKRIFPSNYEFLPYTWSEEKNGWVLPPDHNDGEVEDVGSWPNHLEDLKVQYLGKAGSEIQAGLILASFHAG